MRISFLVFVLLFNFLFAADKKSSIQIKDSCQLEFLNPSLKDRKVSKLILSNGLKVYIISDKNADKSAAALAVATGYWDDPDKYPGMAHFCEHMLFMGSEKYPNPSEYAKFISDNGGQRNAYTSFDKTVYMFSVNTKAFEDSLDRLSHFFIDPLFDPGCISKEIYAIDQEHSKNIENDSRRLWMVAKDLANPNHPFRKFSTGNNFTLGCIPPGDLKRWYDNHYSSNIMALVIYSPLPMDALKKLAIDKFSKIENKNKEGFATKETMFIKSSLGKIVYVKPVSNLQNLTIQWEIDLLENDNSKSLELIAYTLNMGQKNSLYEYLKKTRLVESLTANASLVTKNKYIFELEMKLTDIGLKKYDAIIKICFEALNNLKITSVPKYLFNEMQSMNKLNYELQPHLDAFEFVSDHASNLLNEELGSYPQNLILANEYNEKNIQEYLNKLTYKNSIFFLTADCEKLGFVPDKKEKWTNAEYFIGDLNKKIISDLQKDPVNQDIKLPKPNPFIPKDLKIITNLEKIQKPIKIIDNEYGKVFFFKDDNFNVAEIDWTFKIKDILFSNDIKSFIYKEIYIKALLEKLSSTFFSAIAAGLCPYVYSDANSINISINGYSEKAPLLLEEILKSIKTFTVSKDHFDIFFSSLKKEYENQKKKMPIFQANQYLSTLLLNYNFSADDKIKAINQINYKEFLSFSENVFKTTYIEAFLAGNLSIKDAQSLWVDIKDVLGKNVFSKDLMYKKRVLFLPDEGPYFIHKSTPLLGNGVVLAIDLGDLSLEKKSAQVVLSQAIHEAFFNELRTKQKTAYIAHSTDNELEKRLFQLFLVQSNSHEAFDLMTRFEIFLEEYVHELESQIPQSRFENIKQNLITILENPYKNLKEMSETYCKLAFDYQEDFDWINKRKESLRELKYSDFINLSRQFLSKDNKRRLSVMFEGKLEKPFKYKNLEKDISFSKQKL